MKVHEIIAESKTQKAEAPKPRNFVAKNAKMGGAGQHKDKKKAEKQGDVKHKKSLAYEDRIDEKAKSKAQQKFMGMVYAAKKGEKPASPEVAKAAKGMSKKSAKDYAATKHKGKPEHVEEDATAGSTSAANVSVGAVYKNKKPKMQKPGTNALDMKGGNLMTGGSIKR
jgi:Protein of unknwon function (DUF3008)